MCVHICSQTRSTERASIYGPFLRYLTNKYHKSGLTDSDQTWLVDINLCSWVNCSNTHVCGSSSGSWLAFYTNWLQTTAAAAWWATKSENIQVTGWHCFPPRRPKVSCNFISHVFFLLNLLLVIVHEFFRIVVKLHEWQKNAVNMSFTAVNYIRKTILWFNKLPKIGNFWSGFAVLHGVHLRIKYCVLHLCTNVCRQSIILVLVYVNRKAFPISSDPTNARKD